MAATVLCSVLLLSYTGYVIYRCVDSVRRAKKTGQPIQCCGCSACKTGNCACRQKEMQS